MTKRFDFMTKKEKHQTINHEFFNKYENEFCINDDGDGGRVILSIRDEKLEDEFIQDGSYYSDHYIEYHLSRHTIMCYNRANDYIQDKAEEMDQFLKSLIAKYEL